MKPLALTSQKKSHEKLHEKHLGNLGSQTDFSKFSSKLHLLRNTNTGNTSTSNMATPNLNIASRRKSEIPQPKLVATPSIDRSRSLIPTLSDTKKDINSITQQIIDANNKMLLQSPFSKAKILNRLSISNPPITSALSTPLTAIPSLSGRLSILPSRFNHENKITSGAHSPSSASTLSISSTSTDDSSKPMSLASLSASAIPQLNLGLVYADSDRHSERSISEDNDNFDETLKRVYESLHHKKELYEELLTNIKSSLDSTEPEAEEDSEYSGLDKYLGNIESVLEQNSMVLERIKNTRALLQI